MKKLRVERPLLSILIATKNRIPYAISAINSILRIADSRLELVIQDNSDCRDLEVFIQKNVFDSRIRYRYTPPPFSSIDNFNAAIELATGDFVCLIGDDDGVNPEILVATEWLQKNGFDNLAIKQKINYLWKNTGVSSTLFTKVSGGVLSIREIKSILQFPDVENEMLRLVRNGGVYYLDFNLPKLYHGIVRRSCLESIFKQTGHYLGGLSPDIYSSLSIACVSKKIVVTDYPLTIPGACGASTSVSEGTIKKHSKKLKDAPHFRDRGTYQWSQLVPQVYAVECIWADSGLAALQNMGRLDLIEQFNLPKLAAYCIAANNGVTQQIITDMVNNKIIRKKFPLHISLPSIFMNFMTGPLIKFTRRALNRVMLLLRMRKVVFIKDLDNMEQTTDALINYLLVNQKSIKHTFKG